MSFIGIISEKRKENDLENMIKLKSKQLNLKNNIIIINENSINNIKNIKFDIIIINSNMLDKKEILKKVLINSKKLVINTDININFDILNNIKTTVITYGLNSKATITVSSIREEDILLCIQRSIINIDNEVVEPQEIMLKKNIKEKDAYILMIGLIFEILYGKKYNI